MVIPKRVDILIQHPGVNYMLLHVSDCIDSQRVLACLLNKRLQHGDWLFLSILLLSCLDLTDVGLVPSSGPQDE